MRWRTIGGTIVALLASVLATGCISLGSRTVYAVHYNEAKPNCNSAFAQSNAAAQIPMFNAAGASADVAGASYETAATAPDGSKSCGLLVQNGTFTRTAEVDTSAALQQLQDLKNSTTGLTPTTAQRQSQSEGSQTQTTDVQDDDTVTPTISTAVSGQGTASAPSATTTPAPTPEPDPTE